jgi:ubiquinone/menaquinone biosynthesis C-methylase UbiE
MHDERWRSLRTMFDGVAERYDAARPGYPRVIVDDLVAVAGLEPGSRVLEIGCGTGQLTVDLARRGLDVTAVELGPALAEVARRNLAPYPHARVVVGTFEEYEVAEPVDAVVAASSFHWVAPDARVTRTAAALRPGGALAVIDVRHVAGGTEAFFTESQHCYLRFDPGTQPGFREPTADSAPDVYPELDDAAQFGPVSRRRHTFDVTFTAEGYRDLLSTFSVNLVLPDENREGLFDCLAALIDSRFGGVITKRYLAQLVVARRR